jgi:hypothetical protein
VFAPIILNDINPYLCVFTLFTMTLSALANLVEWEWIFLVLIKREFKAVGRLLWSKSHIIEETWYSKRSWHLSMFIFLKSGDVWARKSEKVMALMAFFCKRNNFSINYFLALPQTGRPNERCDSKRLKYNERNTFLLHWCLILKSMPTVLPSFLQSSVMWIFQDRLI